MYPSTPSEGYSDIKHNSQERMRLCESNKIKSDKILLLGRSDLWEQGKNGEDGKVDECSDSAGYV